MAAKCFFVLAVAFCIAVCSADDDFINPYYVPPCDWNYHYNPVELNELKSRLLTCMKDLPFKPFPGARTPRLDCATAGVDSLRNAPSRTVDGIPAAVESCLRKKWFANILNDRQITNSMACINKSLAKDV